jgi:HPt (histidine-containing phosphotransfer) domain-containing protein
VSKPLSGRKLHEVIERLASTRRSRIAGGTAIDADALLRRAGGDRALMGEIVELFLADAPRMMDAFRVALTAGDAPALARAAHALKGSVANFAAGEAADAAAEVERQAQAGALDAARASHGRVEEEVARVIQALREMMDGEPAGAARGARPGATAARGRKRARLGGKRPASG